MNFPLTRSGPAKSPSTAPTTNGWRRSSGPITARTRGRALIKNIVATLDPVITDGHLALARSVGSGEYWLALNNFLPLTLNVKMSGAPTDFWLLNPVALIFGSVGVNALAPHPNAAKLAENFVLSREAEIFMTPKGRIPTRPDVPTNPPEVGDMLKSMKIAPILFDGADAAKMAEDLQRTVRAQLKASDRGCSRAYRHIPTMSALCFLNRTLCRSGRRICHVLKFFWEILSLQTIDDFVWADVKAHARPIVVMVADRNRHFNLPPGEFPDEPLQLSDDGRSQHIQVADKHNDLRIPGIVPMYRIITMGLAG